MGVSRSTSLVLAYLMKYKRMTLRQAFELVSSRRTCVRPNPGFWRQLLDYEKRLTSSKNEPVASSSSSKYGTPIPITIETSSSSPSGSTLQQERQSLINALTLSNNYTDFRPYSASRVPGATRSSSTSNGNSSEFNSRSSSNYSSYVSPVNQHRTSLVSNPSSKYVKPASFSTTYRSSYGRY